MKKTLAAVALSASLPLAGLAAPSQAADTYPGNLPSATAFVGNTVVSVGKVLKFALTPKAGSNVPAGRATAAPLSKQRGVMKVVVKIGPEGKLKQRYAFTRIGRIGKASSFVTPGALKYKGTYRVVVLFRPYNTDVVGKSRTVFKVRVR